jgi:hypothetical protein
VACRLVRRRVDRAGIMRSYRQDRVGIVMFGVTIAFVAVGLGLVYGR